jgi:hypothetical protein
MWTGRNHAREVAMVADYDRPRRLREGVLHDGQVGCTGRSAGRQGAFEETAAG